MHSDSVIIRAATVEDAQLLADLGARTFYDAFAEDNTESDMTAYLVRSFSLDVQSRELNDPNAVFLIASVAAQSVGYARLRTSDPPPCIFGSRPIEIARLYSDRLWIGRGVGSSLMRACLDHAIERGHDAVWLDVWERNPRAIAFYEKWGFSVVGEQDFVLGEDVQHDLLMARSAG